MQQSDIVYKIVNVWNFLEYFTIQVLVDISLLHGGDVYLTIPVTIGTVPQGHVTTPQPTGASNINGKYFWEIIGYYNYTSWAMKIVRFYIILRILRTYSLTVTFSNIFNKKYGNLDRFQFAASCLKTLLTVSVLRYIVCLYRWFVDWSVIFRFHRSRILTAHMHGAYQNLAIQNM